MDEGSPQAIASKDEILGIVPRLLERQQISKVHSELHALTYNFVKSRV